MAIQWKGEYTHEDLASEGMIGLMQAYDRYDPTKNDEFLIFARPYIQGHMLRLKRKPVGVAVPHGIVEIGWAINRNELNGLPTEEIAERLKKPVGHVERALLYLHTRNPERMDKHVSDDVDSLMHDIIGRWGDFTQVFVDEFTESLDEREKVVLRCLYYDMPQREIASIIGKSQMTVSRTITAIQDKYRIYQTEGVT